jgi:hypothetical protein
MVGGHIVKTGVAPLIIDLMERRVITHLAMNGSGAIHDYEIARFGRPSEDVARGLIDGTFGMAEETDGDERGVHRRDEERVGMGEAVARALEKVPLAHPEMSLLLAAQRLGNSLHCPRGARARSSSASGSEWCCDRDTSHRDFRRLAASLPALMAVALSEPRQRGDNARGFSQGADHRAQSRWPEADEFHDVRHGYDSTLSATRERCSSSDECRW